MVLGVDFFFRKVAGCSIFLVFVVCRGWLVLFEFGFCLVFGDVNFGVVSFGVGDIIFETYFGLFV